MQPSPPTVPRNPRWRKCCRSGDYRFVRHIPNDGIVCPNHSLPQQPLRGHQPPRYDTGDERGATAPLGGRRIWKSGTFTRRYGFAYDEAGHLLGEYTNTASVEKIVAGEYTMPPEGFIPAFRREDFLLRTNTGKNYRLIAIMS